MEEICGRRSRFGAPASAVEEGVLGGASALGGGAGRWWEGSRCEDVDSNIFSTTKLLCHWWFRNVFLTVLGFIMGATGFVSWCF